MYKHVKIALNSTNKDNCCCTHHCEIVAASLLSPFDRCVSHVRYWGWAYCV